MHPARGQAVGEGRRLVAAFCLAVRGQGDGPQTLEPVTTACSGCHVAMTGIVATWVDGVPQVPAAHRGQGALSRLNSLQSL